MSKAFGPLVQIVKGENENYDAAVASAEIMNANAKNIIANFSAGTGRDAVSESRAKPDIMDQAHGFRGRGCETGRGKR